MGIKKVVGQKIEEFKKKSEKARDERKAKKEKKRKEKNEKKQKKLKEKFENEYQIKKINIEAMYIIIKRLSKDLNISEEKVINLFLIKCLSEINDSLQLNNGIMISK